MFIIVSVSTCKNAKLFPITQQKYCHFLKILYFCAEKHVKKTQKRTYFHFCIYIFESQCKGTKQIGMKRFGVGNYAIKVSDKTLWKVAM